MFYTLLKFLGWGALLAFVGGCIGWALRALLCRREVAQARASTVDMEEVERMRHRLANLEQVVAERDRLRIQLADVRHADSPGIVGAEIPEPESEPEPSNEGAEAATGADADADSDGASSSEDEPSIVPEASGEPEGSGENATAVAGFADVGGGDSDADAEPTPEAAEDATEAAVLDLGGAESALGKKIKLDDLTVVEGIGPKISELCNGIGVTTWRQLADTDVAELQSMLDAAGSRYAVHKPGTWPQQAGLLATGQWAEFKTLTDELDGGK